MRPDWGSLYGSTFRVTTAVRSMMRWKVGVRLLATLIVIALIAMIQVRFGIGWVALFLFAPLAVGLSTWYGGRALGIAAAIAGAMLGNVVLPHDDGFAGLSQRTLLLFAALGQSVLTAFLVSWMRDAFHVTDAARLAAQRAAKQGEDQLALAAHELRTPLTSLLAYARLVGVRLRHDPSGATDANAMVVHEAQQASHLITNLLGASLERRSAMELDSRPVDLAAVARAALGAVRFAAEGRHELRYLNTASAPVMGDPTRLEELLVNLLENALKYSPDGTVVELSVTVEDAQVIARVRDEGPGIAEHDQARIFERFYQARRGASGGLGLGLYLSRQIALAHGGTLRLESTGEGSVFALRLPRAEEYPAFRDAQPSYRASTPRRVLLVDDDEGIRQAVVAVLSSVGHECRVASTSTGALAIAEEWRPDVILLDRLGRSEPEFAQVYRQRPRPHAPILALSARWDTEDWARSIDAVATIPKPFDIDELVASVERHALDSQHRTSSGAGIDRCEISQRAQ